MRTNFKGKTNVEAIQKIFLGMLIQTKTATTLDVKNLIRKHDPRGWYTQDVVSTIMDKFATTHSIYHRVDENNGRMYRVYMRGTEAEMKAIVDAIIQAPSKPSASAPAKNPLRRVVTADKGLVAKSPPSFARPVDKGAVFIAANTIPYTCGEYGVGQDDIINAIGRNVARQIWSRTNNVPYRNVYARQAN